MNIVRQASPELATDFMVAANKGEAGDYEAEALAAGCRIHYAPRPGRLVLRLQALGLSPSSSKLDEVLSQNAYDVVHVHGNEFNGDSLRIAHAHGVPVRVSHCHSTVLARGKTGVEMHIRELRRRTLDRKRVLRYATNLVACGRDAGRFMLGGAWESDSRAQIIYCGVRLSAFEQAMSSTSRSLLLEKYALPADAIVIGHAGSMGPSPIKNHAFLMRAFADLSRRSQRYYLFLAGDGPLRTNIEKQACDLGIASRVRMPGVVTNVPSLMVNLFDAHVMPSLAEGLPVAAIEAAAAGVFTVLSENITDELDEHLPGRTMRLSLGADLALWSDSIESAVARREPVAVGIARVRNSPLSIDASLRALVAMYRRQLGQRA